MNSAVNEAGRTPGAAAPVPQVPNDTPPGGGAPVAGALPDAALEAVGGGQGILKLARDLYDLAARGRER